VSEAYVPGCSSLVCSLWKAAGMDCNLNELFNASISYGKKRSSHPALLVIEVM
jgi:hypothetical protein